MHRIQLPSFEQPASLRFNLKGASLDVFYTVGPEQWKAMATDLDASVPSTDVIGGFIGTSFGPCAFRP